MKISETTVYNLMPPHTDMLAHQQQAANAFLPPNFPNSHAPMHQLDSNFCYNNLYYPGIVNPHQIPFNIPRPTNRRKQRKVREKTNKPTPISPSEKPYVCPYEGMFEFKKEK